MPDLTREQLESLKKAAKDYKKSLIKQEEAAEDLREKLNKLKTCSGSSSSNGAQVLADCDAIFSSEYQKLDLD